MSAVIKPFTYGSVCSGIEAATTAWHPLGWSPVFFSEIEAFPRAVLQHHYPDVPLHGDFTTIEANEYGSIDLLVGGTPCQSFSIAGLRGGLDDERGNLALEYLKLAKRKRTQWLVWENVPGVLSSNGGRDFGAFLGGLVELGYGFAYRVLDAQFFGVAQRRRRVFVVGYLGDWHPATAVLFERQSLQGNHAPRREKREDVAGTLSSRSTGGGRLGTDFDLAGGLQLAFGGNNTSGPINVSTAVKGDNGNYDFESETFLAVAFAQNSRDELREMPYAGALSAQPGAKQKSYVRNGMQVRRLTPTECERLQGFPDDYTRIEWRNKPADQCPDGPRYRALGNSMAVPVMHWIGKRIQTVSNLITQANLNECNIEAKS